MLRCAWRCWRLSPPWPLSRALLARYRMPTRSRAADELSFRRRYRYDRLYGRVLLPRAQHRMAALLRRAVASARADQGGQCRARTGDAWPRAARGWPARWAQALRRLVARLARQLDGLANDCARGAARRFFVVTGASALALVLALLL